jgi:hypothetical protein
MRVRSVPPTFVLLLTATSLAAQEGACADQLVSRGNNVTGRTLTVSHEYPGVAAPALFESLRSALAAGSDKLGAVQITRTDPARGVIAGVVTPAGAARPAVLELTVAGLPNGNAQISLTNRLPAAMFVNSRQWATSTCAFLATVSARSAEQPGTTPGSGSVTSAPGVPGATSEARAAAAGIAYAEVISGTLAETEEIDRFRLRNGAAGDTVRMYSRDPREREPADGLSAWSQSDLKVSMRDQGAARTLPAIPGGAVILSGAGPFELRVESDSRAVPYLVQVVKISNRPERLRARVTTGDTIRGEALDYPQDQDEFLFTGRAGEEIQVYLGGAYNLMYQVIHRRAGVRDEGLPRGSAGIIRLPVDGTYVLSVRVGSPTARPFWTGPYWFRIRRRE